jgi:N-acyl-D-amino-acid deacylase
MRRIVLVAALGMAGCGGAAAPPAAPAPAPSVAPAEPASPTGAALAVQAMGRSGVRFNERGRCFSCHHHAVPIVAYAKARSAGLAATDDADWTQVIAFTRSHLTANAAIFGPNEGQVGTIGASYGLWALAEAGQTRDVDTDPLIDIILQCQLEDGSWPIPLYRLPAEAFAHSSTAMAVFALSRFAAPHQRDAAQAAIRKADRWLHAAVIDDEEMEQLAMTALGLWWANSESERLPTLLRRLEERQQADGGFPQTVASEGASDAYATALAVFALRENFYWRENSRNLARARDWLRSRQRPDGYWLQESRAAPVQRYFDNGDPGARDQFITLFATAWASLALTR